MSGSEAESLPNTNPTRTGRVPDTNRTRTRHEPDTNRVPPPFFAALSRKVWDIERSETAFLPTHQHRHPPLQLSLPLLLLFLALSVSTVLLRAAEGPRATPPQPNRSNLSASKGSSVDRTHSEPPCTQNRVRGNLRGTWLLCPSPQIKNHPKTTLLPPASHTFRTFSPLKRVMVTQRKTNKSRRNRRQNQPDPLQPTKTYCGRADLRQRGAGG